MYWRIRRGEALQCSEILAYRTLTDEEIGRYETNLLLMIDGFVASKMEEKRKSSS